MRTRAEPAPTTSIPRKRGGPEAGSYANDFDNCPTSPLPHVENFPEDLRRQAKALAAAKGVTLRGYIIEAVRAAVSREKVRIIAPVRRLVRD